MSVERIKKSILTEAREQAGKIVADAEAKRDERLEKGRRQIENEYEQRFQRAGKKMQQEMERIIMQKRAKHNLELLARRNEMLDSVFDRAAEALSEADDESYRGMLMNWASQIPAGAGGEILCSGEDKERIQPLVKEINRDREAEISLSVDENVESGIIFCSDNFLLDMTVRSKLNELREELAPELAAIIFPDKSAKK